MSNTDIQQKPFSTIPSLKSNSSILDRGLSDIANLDESNTHYLKAKELYDNSNYDESKYQQAIIEYSKAINLAPNIAKYYIGRAEVYFVILDEKNAIKDYNTAIKIDPNNPEYYKARAESWYSGENVTTESALHDGLFQKSIDDYTKAIELDNTDVDAYSERGMIYESFLKDYGRALSDYNKIIELEPNNQLGYVCRASIYSHFEKYAEAILDYKKAINLGRDDDIIYFSLGNIYYNRLNDIKNGIMNYKKGLIRVKSNLRNAPIYKMYERRILKYEQESGSKS